MIDDLDDYDVFLLTWEPSARLEYASLPQSIGDPLVRDGWPRYQTDFQF